MYIIMNTFLFDFSKRTMQTRQPQSRQPQSRQPQRRPPLPQPQPIVTQNPPTEYSKARLWAPLTWMLFHAIAEKIQESHFKIQRGNILNFFKKICLNLPCPYCREDAKIFISTYDFNLINSKDDIKLFFFNFHNRINKKLNKPLIGIDVLEKYKNINILKLSDMWSTSFKRYGSENHEFTESINRNKLRNEYITYIRSNIGSFN